MSQGGLFPYKSVDTPQIITQNDEFAVKLIESFKKYDEKRKGISLLFVFLIFKFVYRFKEDFW